MRPSMVTISLTCEESIVVSWAVELHMSAHIPLLATFLTFLFVLALWRFDSRQVLTWERESKKDNSIRSLLQLGQNMSYVIHTSEHFRVTTLDRRTLVREPKATFRQSAC